LEEQPREDVKVVVAARRAIEGEETVHLVKEAGSDGIFVKTDVANEDWNQNKCCRSRWS
jgi:hypothetical protein